MAYREVKTPIHFPELEKRILDFWSDNDVFEKSVESRSKDKPFVFYEGPPTANGRPGIHHVISRTIKDFVCRYQTMRGYRVERKAGWDTHGLPVEIEVEKALGFTTKEQIEEYGVALFNKKCRESVFTYLKEWVDLTRRMGYWVNLDDAYITYTNEYIETVWHLLAKMWQKELLYQGFKILPYCPRCETALSSHETSLGYKEVTDRSITAKFKLKEGGNRFVLAWTTTPWTLPGNVALAVGPDVDYAEVVQKNKNNEDEIYYIAESRLDELNGDYRILRKLKGSEMEGWTYEPLFDFVDLSDSEHRAYIVVSADFVTTEDGTGVVHTAVMYGEEDYQLGMKEGFPAVHTVDEQGRFNENVSRWQGRYVKEDELEQEIIMHLKTHNRLYKTQKYDHSYPHCWRCDAPLLYYAKKSWYLRTTAVKDQLLKNNQNITWYPKEVGSGRFGQWLENNIDWALSRDRYWGTPLNIWLCESCDYKTAVESIQDLLEKSGLKEIEDLHKPYIDEVKLSCPECGGSMSRTPEVIDCWFDSGAMPFAQFHYPFEKEGMFDSQFPADFIAEGIDQTRGWFYSLLAISTMIKGQSSYKRCLSIEMILDKNGQKMSKSRGNSVDPYTIFNNEGADSLRWYLFTVSPPWVPTRFDKEGVAEVQRKFFGTLANTFGFFVMYANIDQFSYQNPIPVTDRPQIDRWLISSLNRLISELDKYLSGYQVTKAARAIQDFVIDDLSNWYVRRNRRRFWKSEIGDDKIAAYQTLFETLFALSKCIAPFSPFLAEEIYQNLNMNNIEEFESVHLSFYPSPDDEQYAYRDRSLEDQMNWTRDAVSLCRAARNEASIKVRQPLKRAIILAENKNQKEALSAFQNIIKEEVNVKEIEIVESQDSLVNLKAIPNFKKLGPKFASHVNQAAEIIRRFTEDEILSLKNGESINISISPDHHGHVELEDIEIKAEAAEGLCVQSEKELTVALDTVLTDELINEGMAREFVNRVQNMRKNAGYEVTDRIIVEYEGSPLVKKAINSLKTKICDEILALSLEDNVSDRNNSQEFQMDTESVTISILKS